MRTQLLQQAQPWVLPEGLAGMENRLISSNFPTPPWLLSVMEPFQPPRSAQQSPAGARPWSAPVHAECAARPPSAAADELARAWRNGALPPSPALRWRRLRGRRCRLAGDPDRPGWERTDASAGPAIPWPRFGRLPTVKRTSLRHDNMDQLSTLLAQTDARAMSDTEVAFLLY
jgi:hypothetical protein